MKNKVKTDYSLDELGHMLISEPLSKKQIEIIQSEIVKYKKKNHPKLQRTKSRKTVST